MDAKGRANKRHWRIISSETRKLGALLQTGVKYLKLQPRSLEGRPMSDEGPKALPTNAARRKFLIPPNGGDPRYSCGPPQDRIESKKQSSE